MYTTKRIWNSIIIVGFVTLPAFVSAQTESRDLRVDSLDLKIVQQADLLLKDSSKWHKNDDRECKDDIANGTYSMFCALVKASVDITGTYEHRRAGMQITRFTLEKYENGRVKDHRLMDWNNHPDTTFEQVKKVLQESAAAISEKLSVQVKQK
jgi:hypothetical protein